jgi:large subunit ribosomal protein L3
MGNARVIVKNLKVIKADPDRNLLLVRGAVPGARNGLLIIKKSTRGR